MCGLGLPAPLLMWASLWSISSPNDPGEPIAAHSTGGLDVGPVPVLDVESPFDAGLVVAMAAPNCPRESVPAILKTALLAVALLVPLRMGNLNPVTDLV
jgi:hypothetical protein